MTEQDEKQAYIDEMVRKRGYVLDYHKVMVEDDLEFMKAADGVVHAGASMRGRDGSDATAHGGRLLPNVWAVVAGAQRRRVQPVPPVRTRSWSQPFGDRGASSPLDRRSHDEITVRVEHSDWTSRCCNVTVGRRRCRDHFGDLGDPARALTPAFDVDDDVY